MNIDVDLPALEGFEEFDEMPALVSEEFEAAPRFLAVPIDLLWRNTVHYHYPVWVYFLINTCLTGLRSLESSVREHELIPWRDRRRTVTWSRPWSTNEFRLGKSREI